MDGDRDYRTGGAWGSGGDSGSGGLSGISDKRDISSDKRFRLAFHGPNISASFSLEKL